MCDFTAQDYPSPGLGPVVIPMRGEKTGRHLRITVTKMPFEEGRYFFALAEVMVLSGNLNIAVKRRVTTSGTKPPQREWLARNLVDGHPTRSARLFGRRPFLRQPSDQGRLLHHARKRRPPGNPSSISAAFTACNRFGCGPLAPKRRHARAEFPIGFQIHGASTADFTNTRLLHKIEELPNPGNNPVILDGRNAQARYVRIAVTTMHKIATAFAEIEIYAGGHNVARDAKFTGAPVSPAGGALAGKPVERWPREPGPDPRAA